MFLISSSPRDVEKKIVVVVRRDNGEKQNFSIDGVSAAIDKLLVQIQSDMFSKAKKERDDHVIRVEHWKDLVPTLDKRNLVLIPWCEEPECEEMIKERSKKQSEELTDDSQQDDKAPSMGAKSLCIPFDQPPMPSGKYCIQCGKLAKVYGLFGRSY